LPTKAFEVAGFAGAARLVKAARDVVGASVEFDLTSGFLLASVTTLDAAVDFRVDKIAAFFSLFLIVSGFIVVASPGLNRFAGIVSVALKFRLNGCDLS
jgi:hypothetical protein